MYKVQYKELGIWKDTKEEFVSLSSAKAVKNGLENVYTKVRIIKTK